MITHNNINLFWFMKPAHIVGIEALAFSCMACMETPLNMIVLSNIVTTSTEGIQNNNIEALIAIEGGYLKGIYKSRMHKLLPCYTRF